MRIAIDLNKWQSKGTSEISFAFEEQPDNPKLFEHLFFCQVVPEPLHKEEDYFGLANNHPDNIDHRLFEDCDGDDVARYALIEKIIPHADADKLGLDIGCSTGAFTALLHEKGYKAHGLDLCQKTIKQAIKNYPHLLFHNRAIEEDYFLPDAFDIILMTEILEHVYDPAKVMEIIKKIAKKDAMVIISVPNYLSKDKRRWESNEHLRAWYPYGLWKYLEKYLDDMIYYSLRGKHPAEDSFLVLSGKVKK